MGKKGIFCIFGVKKKELKNALNGDIFKNKLKIFYQEKDHE